MKLTALAPLAACACVKLVGAPASVVPVNDALAVPFPAAFTALSCTLYAVLADNAVTHVLDKKLTVTGETVCTGENAHQLEPPSVEY